MKLILWLRKYWWLVPGGLMCVVLALAGCEGGGSHHLSDGHDFGPNDPNLYVALGDSITAGSGLASPSDRYSVKLAGMLNKTVLNAGYPGASSGEVLDACYNILDDNKPGYMLILVGVNDLIMGYGEEVPAVNIRIMVQACKDNKTIPVIATLTPVFYSYARLSDGVERLNDKIRQIASDLDVALVDLNSAFDNNPIYMQTDGLHPNETGNAVMAVTFYDVVN
ncbi:MAG: SGNH/GDSL hydrolase family protein [Kiritimatiellaeota bacterium]|nr:SGNH/GDSL hydrolase family protein [Kiritimatiellota bacterium]